VCGRRAGRHHRIEPGRRIVGFEYVALSRHHIVPRSSGGDDVEPNIVPLCGDGVRGCHGAVEAWDREARAKLRESLRPEEVAYVIERKGEAWLDRNYPRSTESC
jgi:hypothetical protein